MRTFMTMFIGYLILAAAPSLARADACVANFQVTGSVSTGLVLESYDEFPGVEQSTAMQRLRERLVEAGASIVSIDAGVITIENRAPNARPFPIEFRVTPKAAGVRVGVWMKMNKGQQVVEGTKPAICQLLRMMSVDPQLDTSKEKGVNDAETSSDRPSPLEPALAQKAEPAPAQKKERAEDVQAAIAVAEKDMAIWRRSELEKKYGIDEWFSYNNISQLEDNVYKYQGKVVAIRGRLHKIVSPTRGLFELDFINGPGWLVSGIPPEIRDDDRLEDQSILIGKVQGLLELDPFRRYPNLDFLGVYFCERWERDPRRRPPPACHEIACGERGCK